MGRVVEALMCLRGFDFIAAVTIIAEIGDLNRFAHPRALMAYLGLVPSEYSSGKTRRQGAITQSGNRHARRILVESAWNNRYNAQVTRPLRFVSRVSPRSSAISPGKRNCACPSAREAATGRKLAHNKVCVAIARELAGFIWDLARHVKLHA